MRIAMRAAALSLALALSHPAAAGQLAHAGSVEVWFSLTACPASWVAAGETRPAEADLYRLEAVAGAGRRIYFDESALAASYTVAGVLDTAARDAAIADGTVELIPGRAATILCLWRPTGGVQ